MVKRKSNKKRKQREEEERENNNNSNNDNNIIETAEREQEEEEEEIEEIEGESNDRGELEGHCKVKYKNGNQFEGNFESGKRIGKGTIKFVDGAILDGSFQNNLLQGICTLIFPPEEEEEDENQRGRMEAMYEDGVVNGECKEWDGDGRLTFEGIQRGNEREGKGTIYFEGGGRLEGKVDLNGQLKDESISYFYPDGSGYIGKWKDIIMIEGYYCENVAETLNNEKKRREAFSSQKFKFDPPTKKRISRDCLLADPYESKHVYVDNSAISNANEGLFAKQFMAKGTVAAFYSGIHLSHKEVDNRSWSLNNNTISVTDFVIDVPFPFDSTKVYSASLGHKANHSFQPNCIYGYYEHPRFGYIRTVQVCKEEGVMPNEELLIDYDYHEVLPDGSIQAPDWYLNIRKQKQ
eukprot:TRINITY_DN3074_c0_g1_i1.p1 TRINITY_DN3074_c0_g1~~TRINITY_DN3074_c0_g1_i1.p1  ORF type:complete len:459 (+),score=153.65 TRINITY_DN3074_c0_g1_i1:157-1377(+)